MNEMTPNPKDSPDHSPKPKQNNLRSTANNNECPYCTTEASEHVEYNKNGYDCSNKWHRMGYRNYTEYYLAKYAKI